VDQKDVNNYRKPDEYLTEDERKERLEEKKIV
jgi:hypothetical protein